MQNENPRKHRSVESRNAPFVKRTVTGIWLEKAAEDNPYITTQAWCQGYDLLELMQHRSFVEVLFLLFSGELPDAKQLKLLESLMVGLMNPGPRHPATRAAMNAAVGKTNPLHILPIGLSIMGGNHLGAGNIEAAMQFFEQHQASSPEQIFKQLAKSKTVDANITPGFGKRFGGRDQLTENIAQQLLKLDAAGTALAWGQEFADQLKPLGQGWLVTGLAAAVFSDLKFPAHLGGPLFQLISAPGLLAHAAELIKKPITAMPFIADDQYHIER